MAEPICFTTNTEVAIEFDGDTFTLKKGNNVIFLSRKKMLDLGTIAECVEVCPNCNGTGTDGSKHKDEDGQVYDGFCDNHDCNGGLIIDKMVEICIAKLEGKVRT